MRAKRKNPTRVLNERVGILGPCLHRDKHLLGRVKTRVGNQVGGGSEVENPLEERSQAAERRSGTTRSGREYRELPDQQIPALDNG